MISCTYKPLPDKETTSLKRKRQKWLLVGYHKNIYMTVLTNRSKNAFDVTSASLNVIFQTPLSSKLPNIVGKESYQHDHGNVLHLLAYQSDTFNNSEKSGQVPLNSMLAYAHVRPSYERYVRLAASPAKKN